MTSFQISALPPQDMDRIRGRGVDDFGNPLVVMTQQDEGGVPLRCCLREAAIGERYALIAWQPAEVGGAYAEVGPVFIHAERCGGYAELDAYRAAFRRRRQILRAYDADGWQVENRLVDGSEAEGVITELFARPDIAIVHSRNVLAGCYMFRISRGHSMT